MPRGPAISKSYLSLGPAAIENAALDGYELGLPSDDEDDVIPAAANNKKDTQSKQTGPSKPSNQSRKTGGRRKRRIKGKTKKR